MRIEEWNGSSMFMGGPAIVRHRRRAPPRREGRLRNDVDRTTAAPALLVVGAFDCCKASTCWRRCSASDRARRSSMACAASSS